MLENILINYFGLQEDWNDIYEKEQENWYNAYNKLLALIYDLQKLGVIHNANEIVDKLDFIDSIIE